MSLSLDWQGWDESFMEMSAYASWSQRIRHFSLNGLAFTLCYQATNQLALQNAISRDAVISFDAHIPFLAWMIVPYLCSGLFFIASFFTVRSLDDVRVLSQRMLLATVVACLVFALYPLRFSIARPAIESPVFSAMFDALLLFDQPYNQLPSLHVAYCLIFWASLSACLKKPAAKIVLASILILISLATLFTYQHHLLDVIAGFALGVLCAAIITPEQTQIKVGFYYLMFAGIVLIVGVMYAKSWCAGYLAVSLSLVAVAYYQKNRYFLHKKTGQHSLLIWLLYAPYLIGYRLTWWLVQYRERHHPAFRIFAKQLWVGRRLNAEQAKNLPENCAVIDLSPELSELKPLSRGHYQHFPLHDLVEPDAATVEEIAASIRKHIAAGRNVYLHCAMGYQRCIIIAEHSVKNIPT
jgi:membrane-associated phospholipid phosphatase